MGQESENKFGQVTFEEDPKQYCQGVYDKASKHNQTMSAQVVEDRAFFDGADPELEKRKRNPRVRRAAEFVPETRTAIETNESSVLDRALEDPLLVRLNVKEEYEDEEAIIELVTEKEAKLNEQMRSCGFLMDTYMEWFRGSQVQPLSVVKLDWEEKEDWIPQQKSPFSTGTWLKALIRGKIPQAVTKFEWGVVSKQPTVMWLDYDEFLYDTSASKFEDCKFMAHRRWLEWDEVLNEAKRSDWNMREVRLMKEECEGTAEALDKRIAEQVTDKTDKIVDPRKEMKENKFLIVEFWVRTYSEGGEREIHRVVLGNNYYLLDNRLSEFKGIDFPFRDRVAFKRLGMIEGMSAVSRVKPIQRLYNDMHNVFLDAASYGVLPPMLMERNTNILDGEPRWEPLGIIRVDNIDGVKWPEVNIGHIELIPSMIEMYAQKIQQELNASGMMQNTPEDPQEKATKTRIRFSGANRRLRPIFQAVQEDLKAVAEMFIKFNQIYDPEWIILDYIEISVPVLDGTSTPEDEKMAAMGLYEAAMTNPLYQSPVGMTKLLELWRDVLNKFRVEDIDSRCLTSEELEEQIITETVDQFQEGIKNGTNPESDQGSGNGVDKNRPRAGTNA